MIPGGFGVTIFFFLSGYLITTLMRLEMEKAGRLSFGGFYLRRTVRIIPPMLICIGVTVALALAGLIDREIDLSWLWTDLLVLTNYAASLGGSSSIPIPLWSFDVEEHFYLLFPLVYVAARSHSVTMTIFVILVGIAVALAMRMAAFQAGDVSPIFHWTQTRIDFILFWLFAGGHE